MKLAHLLLTTFLSAPLVAFASEPVNIDIYLAGELAQSATLNGYRSFFSFAPKNLPNTRLELRLIAPEPLIFDLKETTLDGEIIQRIKLPTPGSSFDVSEIKGTKLHNAYVFVRPN